MGLGQLHCSCHRQCRINTSQFVLRADRPSGLGAARGYLRSRLDNFVFSYGRRSLACLARRRISRCTHFAHTLPCAACSQCALELALLWLAPGRFGVRRHRSAVGAYRCNTRCVLAHLVAGRSATHSISLVGQLRLGTQLFGLATQPAALGITCVRLWSLHPRSPACFEQWRSVEHPTCHPLFRSRSGGIATWERGSVAPDLGSSDRGGKR